MNYQSFILKNNIEVENAFDYLYENFLPTIATYSFLVDWQKVKEHRASCEIKLNILNSLVGKCDNEFYLMFEKIIKNYPEVVEVFPILLASRDKELEFVDNLEDLNIDRYIFKKPVLINSDIIEHYFDFFKNTKLYELFCNKDIKNLVDYVFGVEVGLNSNARKNRTGKSMETIVKNFLSKFCQINPDFAYIEQATQKRIKESFDYRVKIDKNNRRFDFALFNKKDKKLYLIEVNFYSGGGSKLKATAGEYKELNDFLKNQDLKFIWITDGKGWTTARNSLEETFNHNDYVININMLKNGILYEICK